MTKRERKTHTASDMPYPSMTFKSVRTSFANFAPSSGGRYAAPLFMEATLLKSAFSIPGWFASWCTTEGMSGSEDTLYLK